MCMRACLCVLPKPTDAVPETPPLLKGGPELACSPNNNGRRTLQMHCQRHARACDTCFCRRLCLQKHIPQAWAAATSSQLQTRPASRTILVPVNLELALQYCGDGVHIGTLGENSFPASSKKRGSLGQNWMRRVMSCSLSQAADHAGSQWDAIQRLVPKHCGEGVTPKLAGAACPSRGS